MNRSLVTTLLILSTWGWAFGAQSSGLPNGKVKKAFKQMYPVATEVDWKENEEGTIVAYFEMEDGNKEAYFDSQGNWLHTVTYIIDKDLPKGVIRYVKENYEEAAIYDTRKYQDPDTPLEFKVILTVEDWEYDEEKEEDPEEEEVVYDEFSDWISFLVLSFSEGGKLLSVEKFKEY
ncbi:MAG: hypothetical protein R8G66_25925 [Cytophagales bacterium]|nr:hypothetical protein [Cytophagales bacterium]